MPRRRLPKLPRLLERKIYKTADVWVCGELDDVFGFCFLCVKEGERAEKKAYREYMENNDNVERMKHYEEDYS